MQNPLEQLLENPTTQNINEALRLISAGADANTQNAEGDTVLHHLARRLDTDRAAVKSSVKHNIERLIRVDHADPNKKNKGGKTPLDVVVRKFNWNLSDAVFMIRAGANANQGALPLIHQLVSSKEIYESDRKDIIQLIDEGRLDIHCKDGDGKTAFERLLDKSNWLLRDAIFLLSCGANPKSTNSQAQPLLHLLLNREINADGQLSAEIKQLIVQLIEKYGIDPNSKDGQERTALQVLMSKVNWNVEDAFFLIELGANPNVLNANGQSLVHHLVLAGEQMNVLLLARLIDKHGVDPNIRDSQGRTALQRYLDRSTWQPSEAMYLVCLGADPNTIDSRGQSLLFKLATPISTKRITNRAQLAMLHLVKTFKVDPMKKNARGDSLIDCYLRLNTGSKQDIDFLQNLGGFYVVPMSARSVSAGSIASAAAATSSSSQSLSAVQEGSHSIRIPPLSDLELDKIIKPLKTYAEKTKLGFSYHSHVVSTNNAIAYCQRVKRLPVIQIELEYLVKLFDVIDEKNFNVAIEVIEPHDVKFCDQIARTPMLAYKNKEQSGFYKALKVALIVANELTNQQQQEQDESYSLDKHL